ncbi:unnamed protein product, partial [Ectocarpus sp. 8 AP-2014]
DVVDVGWKENIFHQARRCSQVRWGLFPKAHGQTSCCHKEPRTSPRHDNGRCSINQLIRGLEANLHHARGVGGRRNVLAPYRARTKSPLRPRPPTGLDSPPSPHPSPSTLPRSTPRLRTCQASARS